MYLCGGKIWFPLKWKIMKNCFVTIAFLVSAVLGGSAQTVFSSDNGDGTYTNPIIRGDYPDTDIIRVGDDFYMISSSFACMPGIPVCHSKDLIHWEVIGHAYDKLSFLPTYSMEKENTAYGRACWAPTMRYYDGWYYIGVNLKSDRFIMCKSRKPEGPYTMYSFNEELYDPGMFIDDDGKKYITHGMNDVRITRLRDDGTEIMTPGDKGTVIIHAPETHHLYFEGCHMYKHNGYYYVFNPSQGYDGFQMVSRSRNIMGPYETRVLIDDDLNYANAGVHQGGMVETSTGETWAFTFQDRDYMGRDIMLYPVRWADDWPVVDTVPVTFRKPDCGSAMLNDSVDVLMPSVWTDEFCDKKLQPIWEFSHVPVAEKWSLKDHKGFLRIYASPAKGYEWARNSLTYKAYGPSSTATVKVDVSGLKDNDFAGLGIMGSTMLQQGVMKKGDTLYLQIHQSQHKEDEMVSSMPLPLSEPTLYLRADITKRGTVQFSYSIDGKDFKTNGGETPSGFWRFLGLRYALCCYNAPSPETIEQRDSAFYTTENVRDAMSGYADFDSFSILTPWHGNNYDAFALNDFDMYDVKSDMDLVRPIDYDPFQYLATAGHRHRDKVSEAGHPSVSFYNLHFCKSASKVNIELKARLSNDVITLHDGDADGPVLGICNVKATGGKWSRQSFKVSVPQGRHRITFVLEGNTDKVKLKNYQFE